MTKKRIGMVLICLGALLTFSACGKKDVEVSIADGQVETKLMVSAGETVADVLSQAEITLNEEDIVTPDINQKISESGDTISIDRCTNVTIEDRDDDYVINLTGKKVEDALDELDLTLGKNDLLNHSMEAYLTDGMDIVIERRYGVNVAVDGNEDYILTGTTTVQDLLDEQNIKMGKDDRISPKLTKKLKDDMEIVINRVTKEKETVNETVAYGTTYEDSSSMYEGSTSVKQEGVNGTRKVTYEVTYVDGEEESRKQIDSVQTKAPVNQIVLRGTKKQQTSSSGSSRSSSKSSGSKSSGKSVTSTEKVYDCDGSGHGYEIKHYSDGSTSQSDF